MSATEKKKRVFQSDSDVRCRVPDVAKAGRLSLGREGYKPTLLTWDSVMIPLRRQPAWLRCQSQGTSELVLPAGRLSGWLGPSQMAW